MLSRMWQGVKWATMGGVTGFFLPLSYPGMVVTELGIYPMLDSVVDAESVNLRLLTALGSAFTGAVAGGIYGFFSVPERTYPRANHVDEVCIEISETTGEQPSSASRPGLFAPAQPRLTSSNGVVRNAGPAQSRQPFLLFSNTEGLRQRQNSQSHEQPDNERQGYKLRTYS